MKKRVFRSILSFFMIFHPSLCIADAIIEASKSQTPDASQPVSKVTSFQRFGGPTSADQIAHQGEWENFSTLEVTAALRGQGLIVLINGQPRILTNSHVIQGKKESSLNLPWREELPLLRVFDPKNPSAMQGYEAKLKAQLEFDSPLADIAILAPDPDTDPKVIERLKMYAAGAFCSKGIFSCKNGFEQNREQVVSFAPIVYSSHQNARKSTLSLRPYLSGGVPDFYVSGKMKSLLKVPVFAIPGMSGGSYFERGNYFGMITKIELGGAGEAYAIPYSEISKVIGPYYFKDQDQLRLPPSHWGRDPNGYRLIVENEGHRLSMPFSGGKLKAVGGDTGNGGGDTGNGGGDTGNGGGDTGNGGGKKSALWRLEVRDLFGRRDAVVNDPFAHSGKSDFTIDGKSVAYFKTKDEITGRTLYMSPTMAHYFWLESNRKGSFETVYVDQSARDELEKARLVQASPRYVRVYSKSQSGTFELLTDFGTNGVKRAGAQSLTPCPTPFEPTQDPLEAISRLSAHITSLIAPVSENDDVESITNISTHLSELFVDRPNSKNLSGKVNLRVSKDLSSISYARDEKLIKLTPVGEKDGATVIYRAEGSPAQAAVIYKDIDLSQVERIYIQDPDLLFEFVNCEIGKECYR